VPPRTSSVGDEFTAFACASYDECVVIVAGFAVIEIANLRSANSQAAAELGKAGVAPRASYWGAACSK